MVTLIIQASKALRTKDGASIAAFKELVTRELPFRGIAVFTIEGSCGTAAATISSK